MDLSSLYRFSRFSKLLVLGVAATALQGCGMIYKSTGDILISYGKSDMLPYVMTKDDVEMSCAMGESMTPLLMSFESVGSNPDKLAVMVFTTAASCSDKKALEAQLSYERNLKSGNVNEAQDARIQQKRWASLSAKRQLIAYNRAIKAYGEVTEARCPKLKSDFDEMVWMVGMLSGLQALMNDTAAEGAVGVPRNIAGKAADGAACLDDAKWWGVPDGMRGAVWNMLPMLAPEGTDSWAMLEQAADRGFANGIRLGSALYAMAAYSKGDDARLKQAIRDFAKRGTKVNENYRQLDAMAEDIVLGLSDRLWTKATGKRTPFGELGSFWDDAKAGSDINIDDLLN